MYIGRLIVIITIFLLLILSGVSFWWYQTTGVENPVSDVKNDLVDIDFDPVDRKFIAVSLGKGISKISLQALSVVEANTTPVEITLGTMRKNTSPEMLNGELSWIFNIPEKEPSGLVKIFAIAYDKNGDEIDRIDWPMSDVSEIKNILWPVGEVSKYDLVVGESFTHKDLKVKLIDVPQDSRCPIDVECIQAGFLTVDLEVMINNKTQILSLKSGENKRQIGAHYINISEVFPDKEDGVTLSIGDYRVSFVITSAN